LYLNVGGCPIGTFTTTTGAIELPMTAEFEITAFELTAPMGGTVNVEPFGWTCTAHSYECKINVAHPTKVTMTATPDPGMQLVGWYKADGSPLTACGSATTCVLPAKLSP